MSFATNGSLDEMATDRPATVAFTVRGPIQRDDLPGLYARICVILGGSKARRVYCEVDQVAADAVSADALARLQLAARRPGCQITLRGASEELRGLIAFMGLKDVLAGEPL